MTAPLLGKDVTNNFLPPDLAKSHSGELAKEPSQFRPETDRATLAENPQASNPTPVRQIGLALTRFSINGNIVALGVWLDPSVQGNILQAMAIGGVAGSLSGTVQYFNPELTKMIAHRFVWPTKSDHSNPLVKGKQFGKKFVSNLIRPATDKKSGLAGKFFKNYLVETTFISAIYLTSDLVGMNQDLLSTRPLWVAAIGTMSQGPWIVAVSKRTQDLLHTNPHLEKRILKRSGYTMAGISALATLGAALKLFHVDWTTPLLFSLGTSGVGALAYAHKEEMKEWGRSTKKTCLSVLRNLGN